MQTTTSVIDIVSCIRSCLLEVSMFGHSFVDKLLGDV